MKTIQEFHLLPGSQQFFQFPQGSEILSLKPEGGTIILYALIGQGPVVDVKIDCFRTGEPTPYDDVVKGKFIGSCSLFDGQTFHVFQRL